MPPLTARWAAAPLCHLGGAYRTEWHRGSVRGCDVAEPDSCKYYEFPGELKRHHSLVPAPIFGGKGAMTMPQIGVDYNLKFRR